MGAIQHDEMPACQGEAIVATGNFKIIGLCGGLNPKAKDWYSKFNQLS
jgi:hypothetical protein